MNWIEAEDGKLYNTHYIQQIELRSSGQGQWVIRAVLANGEHETLKGFTDEDAAREVLKALKKRLGDAIELVPLNSRTIGEHFNRSHDD